MGFAIVGWAVLFIPLVWASLFVYIITLNPMGGCFFDWESPWYEKVFGVIAYVLLASGWVWWLSFLTIDIQ